MASTISGCLQSAFNATSFDQLKQVRDRGREGGRERERGGGGGREREGEQTKAGGGVLAAWPLPLQLHAGQSSEPLDGQSIAQEAAANISSRLAELETTLLVSGRG